MEIKTEYNIGQRVWILYENKGEVCIYDDTIIEIAISEDGVSYLTKEYYDDLKENEIIPYESTKKLVEEIVKAMENIHANEK